MTQPSMKAAPIDWVLFTGVLVAYLIAAVAGMLRHGRSAVPAVFAVLGSVLVLVVRSRLDEVSQRGTVRTAAVLFGVLLVVSRGRPATLFDLDEPSGRELRTMSKDRRRDVLRRGRSATYAQAALLLVIVVGTGLYALAGWTFLD